jgi:hypothetical protein
MDLWVFVVALAVVAFFFRSLGQVVLGMLGHPGWLALAGFGLFVGLPLLLILNL